jgi:putative Ca2+/H+ antiporter (TMEM165/GDT1 family)
MVVFAGAFGSLVVMSILSAAMGHLLPTLIPRSWTQFAAAVLFLVFGAKMFSEAKQMKGGNDKIQEEMREAEEEIEDDDAVHDGTGLPSATPDGHIIPLEEMEEGGRNKDAHNDGPVSPRRSTSRSTSKTTWAEGTRNFCSLLLGPVFVQAFILTFLGEWGDRSQIATIALGAAHVRFGFPTYPNLYKAKYACANFTERLPCDHRNRCRTLVLYRTGCNWRPICIYKNIR